MGQWFAGKCNHGSHHFERASCGEREQRNVDQGLAGGGISSNPVPRPDGTIGERAPDNSLAHALEHASRAGVGKAVPVAASGMRFGSEAM